MSEDNALVTVEYRSWPGNTMQADKELKRYRVIGVGSARTCYDLGFGVVIKVDNRSSSYQHDAEIAVWEKATDKQRELLAPILAYGPGYTIMVKGEPVDAAAGYEVEEDLRSRLEAQGLSTSDIHPHNIKMFDGKARLVDYGL